MIMRDKNGKEIKAGDTLLNPWDTIKYHQVLEGTDGRLYHRDLDSPLEEYRTNEYWEISNDEPRDDIWPEEESINPPTQSPIDAPAILRKAAQTIDDRAADRDLPAERSMARAVGAFNTLTGQSLTITQGWLFMAVLKLARATAGKFNPDDQMDAAAYVALALENEILEKEKML